MRSTHADSSAAEQRWCEARAHAEWSVSQREADQEELVGLLRKIAMVLGKLTDILVWGRSLGLWANRVGPGQGAGRAAGARKRARAATSSTVLGRKS